MIISKNFIFEILFILYKIKKNIKGKNKNKIWGNLVNIEKVIIILDNELNKKFPLKSWSIPIYKSMKNNEIIANNVGRLLWSILVSGWFSHMTKNKVTKIINKV